MNKVDYSVMRSLTSMGTSCPEHLLWTDNMRNEVYLSLSGTGVEALDLINKGCAIHDLLRVDLDSL